MIIPPALLQKYTQSKPYIDEVGKRVRDIVSAFCESNGYAYLGRVKDTESLSEKIETGRFRSWSDLDDLFACSVILPTLSDEEKVLAHLAHHFHQVDCKRRGATQKDPLVFRFDATRFIGRLKAAAHSDASGGIFEITFEIQIRSAFEHAWSVTTHALAYKSTRIDWRHLRLAAQLRAAVEQLDQVVSGFEQTAHFIGEQSWPDISAQKRIGEFFTDLIEKKVIPSEVAPKSLGRFAGNLLSLIRSSSGGKRIHDLPPYVENALKLIAAELATTPIDEFPRSISLIQFCAAALARHGLFTQAPDRFVPIVTKELLDLYPHSEILGQGFDFQLTSN